MTESWALLGGYRTLTIEREFGERNITLDLSGFMLGAQMSF